MSGDKEMDLFLEALWSPNIGLKKKRFQYVREGPPLEQVTGVTARNLIQQSRMVTINSKTAP